MDIRRQAGFSVVKFLVVLAVCLAIISGVLYGVYSINRSSHINGASDFMSDFISKVEKKDTIEAFEMFGDNLKKPYEITAFDTWRLWIEPLQDGTVKIDKSSEVVEYKNSSFLATSTDGGVVTFTYKVQEDTKIYFSVSSVNEKWVVNDYGVI